MNGRYQLLYYVPDSLLGERVILGAVVREGSGESAIVVREPVSLAGLRTGDQNAQYRALLSSLSQADAAAHLPSVLGPDVELGDERTVPSQVVYAREWVQSLLRSRETVLEWAVQGVAEGNSVRVPMVIASTTHRVEMPRYTSTKFGSAVPTLASVVANDVQQVA